MRDQEILDLVIEEGLLEAVVPVAVVVDVPQGLLLQADVIEIGQPWRQVFSWLHGRKHLPLRGLNPILKRSDIVNRAVLIVDKRVTQGRCAYPLVSSLDGCVTISVLRATALCGGPTTPQNWWGDNPFLH